MHTGRFITIHLTVLKDFADGNSVKKKRDENLAFS